VQIGSEDRWDRLAERVSAVWPCETDEDRERLLELLGPLTVPELAALVETLRRYRAARGHYDEITDSHPPSSKVLKLARPTWSCERPHVP
jgi:hypothetical protein